jgi:PAS domain S-box-containing protein
VGRFCFAVARDNADLLARLNEGYHLLHTSGRYDEIYRKWFSVYTQKRYFALVLKIALAGCALLMVLSASVFIWNRMLKRLVDRKTAALHESEVRYRELTDLLPQMVFETDAAGRFTFINRHGFELCGYSPEEIDQGLEALSLFDTADRERIGAIIANRPDIYGAFTRHLLNYMGDASTQEATMWSLCEIAAVRPDLIRKTPFYSAFHFLQHDNPVMRGLMARILGRMQAKEAMLQVAALQHDLTEITIYDKGIPLETTVAQEANLAVGKMHEGVEHVQ